MAPQKPVIASAYSDVQNDQHYDDGISDGGSGGYRDENDDEEYNMNVGSGDGSGYGKHTIMASILIVSNRVVRLCCRFDDARRLRRRVAQPQRIGDDGTGSGTRLGARQRPDAGHHGVRRAGPAVERRHRQRRSATLSAAQRPSQSLPPPFPSDPHHRCQRVGVKTRTPPTTPPQSQNLRSNTTTTTATKREWKETSRDTYTQNKLYSHYYEKARPRPRVMEIGTAFT